VFRRLFREVVSRRPVVDLEVTTGGAEPLVGESRARFVAGGLNALSCPIEVRVEARVDRPGRDADTALRASLVVSGGAEEEIDLVRIPWQPRERFGKDALAALDRVVGAVRGLAPRLVSLFPRSLLALHEARISGPEAAGPPDEIVAQAIRMSRNGESAGARRILLALVRRLETGAPDAGSCRALWSAHLRLHLIALQRSATEAYFTHALSAIRWISRFLDEGPDDYVAFLDRGVCRDGLYDYEGAVEDYTRAIEIDGRDHRAVHNRAGVRGRLGDFQGALEDYTRAIELGPRVMASRIQRAQLYRDHAKEIRMEERRGLELAECDLQIALEHLPPGTTLSAIAADMLGRVRDQRLAGR